MGSVATMVSMRANDASDGHTLPRNHGTCASAGRDTRRAFTVLTIAPCADPVSADTIHALCERIPGVGALHVDVDRGRLHVLYDGTVQAVEQIEQALGTLGHRIRTAEVTPSAVRRANVPEDPA